jgi:photosystem II stability/assembly factor-like uncharacterized protein
LLDKVKHHIILQSIHLRSDLEYMILSRIFSKLSWKRATIIWFLIHAIFSSWLVLDITRLAINRYEPAQESETTWEYLNHDFPNAEFWDVKFLNATHGWVVGELSPNVPSDIIVLSTDDGGNSWQLQHNQSSQWVTIMDVVDEQTVWINGLGSLFYTTDGGQTWNESAVLKVNAALSTVKFINKTHGWTANNWVLYKTTDGGKTWESVPGWAFKDSPRMMQILSPMNIWAIGFG